MINRELAEKIVDSLRELVDTCGESLESRGMWEKAVTTVENELDIHNMQTMEIE